MPDKATATTTAATAQRGDGASEIGIETILLAARRRRGDDAGRAEARGSLMRHFPLANLSATCTFTGSPGDQTSEAVDNQPAGDAYRHHAREWCAGQRRNELHQ